MAFARKNKTKTQLPTLTTTPRSASRRDLASWFELRPWLDNGASFSGLIESNGVRAFGEIQDAQPTSGRAGPAAVGLRPDKHVEPTN